jgi:hypothetical protein
MLQHADYPHTPGMLYDCHACESACSCEAWGESCVGCEVAREKTCELFALCDNDADRLHDCGALGFKPGCERCIAKLNNLKDAGRR